MARRSEFEKKLRGQIAEAEAEVARLQAIVRDDEQAVREAQQKVDGLTAALAIFDSPKK